MTKQVDPPLVIIEIYNDGTRFKANNMSADDVKKVIFELETAKFQLIQDFLNKSSILDLKNAKKT